VKTRRAAGRKRTGLGPRTRLARPLKISRRIPRQRCARRVFYAKKKKKKKRRPAAYQEPLPARFPRGTVRLLYWPRHLKGCIGPTPTYPPGELSRTGNSDQLAATLALGKRRSVYRDGGQAQQVERNRPSTWGPLQSSIKSNVDSDDGGAEIRPTRNQVQQTIIANIPTARFTETAQAENTNPDCHRDSCKSTWNTHRSDS